MFNRNKTAILCILTIVFFLVASGCKTAPTVNDPLPQNYQLAVTLGAGVDGQPAAGTTTRTEGETINYNYQLKTGFTNLKVKLDGAEVQASGSFTMNQNKTLTATADELPEAGAWSGTTSKQQPMSFKVSHANNAGAVENFKVKVAFKDGAVSGTIETTITGPHQIGDNKFSWSSSTLTFSGEFTSPTNAKGRYAFINYPINLGYWGTAYVNQSGTWTASQ